MRIIIISGAVHLGPDRQVLLGFRGLCFIHCYAELNTRVSQILLSWVSNSCDWSEIGTMLGLEESNNLVIQIYLGYSCELG